MSTRRTARYWSCIIFTIPHARHSLRRPEKVHRVAVCSNFFSKSPNPTLGRNRYTDWTIFRTFHWYFFSYAVANFSKSACCVSINSTEPSRITAFAAFSVPITHLGSSARLRALRDLVPVLNQKLSPNQRPQTIIRWGAPLGRVVAIQYCLLLFNRSAAHFQGSSPFFLAKNS